MVVSVMSTCVMFRLCGLFDDDDDDDDDGGKRNEHVCDVQIVWGICIEKRCLPLCLLQLQLLSQTASLATCSACSYIL